MTEQMTRRVATVAVALTLAATAGCARTTMTPTAETWLGTNAADFRAPGFPMGARIAVLHGNPADTGNFVVRLGFPDGYAVPPHWHPTTETVTVLRGTFVLGMGEQADRSQARPVGVGGVAVAPARMPHYAWAQGETVVQVHGRGPFQLNLVGQTP
jgi:quercetin dioxygenase-like cupin family protein